jgi:hypothetical protein
VQYVSRHSSAARRNSQTRMLLQPLPSDTRARYASVVAGLPSLGGGDFVLPAPYRLGTPTTPKAAAAPTIRPLADKPMDTARALFGLGIGSTVGLCVGALLCSLL